MRSLKTSLTVIGAVVVLLLAGNTVAYAATGGKFFLGKTNKADQVSTLKRTTSGAALNLVTKSSSNAPLTTNGKGKVANLNADSLDGKDSSAFQTKVGALVWHDLSLAPGWSGNCYTATPQYAVRFGVVYLRGDLCGGTTNTAVFTVPTEARPARGDSFLYLVVDQEDAATGRIYLDSGDGTATSECDPDHAGADTGFISLEGVSYTL
jgi:hypothetical protein